MLFATAKKRTVRIPGVASDVSATVTVAGLKPDGSAGPAAKAKLARKRR